MHKDNITYAVKLKKFLIDKYKIAPENIAVLFSGGMTSVHGAVEVSRNNVLKLFSELESKLGDNDELWLFISGYASHNKRGYSLATKKGRLRGSQLKDFLNKVKGRKYVFCFTPAGGSLLKDIKDTKKLIGISATDSSRQNSMPRLNVFFARKCEKSSSGNLMEIINDSVTELHKFYKSQSLLLPETAVLIDNGKITRLPQGDNNKYVAGVFPSIANVSYKDSKVQISGKWKRKGNIPGIPKLQPATEQSKALIAAAEKIAEKFKEYNACFIDEKSEVLCNRDKSVRYNIYKQIYLANQAGAENFVFYKVPRTSRLETAKIIYPDGTCCEPEPFACGQHRVIQFPSPGAGCLLEVRFQLDKLPGKQIYEIFGNIPIQHRYPVVKSQITLEQAKKLPVYSKLVNTHDANSVTEKRETNKITYIIKNVPALELLPGDPSESRVRQCFMFSSVKKWTELAELYERLSRTASKLNADTEKIAKDITAGADSELEKLRNIYEYLCDLRYMTTPVGVSALKPRTPSQVIKERYGDCKDKANALVVLAKALGIKGHVALLNRGKYTDTKFPSWQFNHAVAYFPALKLWCDATDGSTPFGSLPPGDIGRQALVLDGKNSHFKTVKLFSNNINRIEQEITFSNDNGFYKGRYLTILRGLPDYQVRRLLKRMGPREKRAFMQGMLNDSMELAELNNYKIISSLEELNNPLRIKIEFSVPFAPSKMKIVPGRNILKVFMLESRPYGAVINDGQPLQIIQKISANGDIVKHDVDTSINKVGLSLKVLKKVSKKSWSRETSIVFSKGCIDNKEYKSTRKSILKFYSIIFKNSQ